MREKFRVLIADDDQKTRKIYVQILKKNTEFQVEEAKNGKEAMEIIREERPDLIIMDILMPMQGGIMMYRELKIDDSFKDIPVIIYSGIAKRTFLRTQEARTEFGDQRVPPPDGYIEKPAKPAQLESVIKDILG